MSKFDYFIKKIKVLRCMSIINMYNYTFTIIKHTEPCISTYYKYKIINDCPLKKLLNNEKNT